ncbi:NAD(P)/FAD-dependent oxidoreductase [Clostridium sp. CM028]|uniref:NAD(P)/FAD-dependent oxidoreductase n=1 Tax=unclassified Clostridium TaxID=2614128 RepID=UPI001C0ACC4B|nr:MULTISPECIES: NAD(P)/FAD-dependent oxidoreductase [unclassified Clostridium]MBU3091402.1 NAD(P)/FAD-dependent oxidoreductase [Clostridium sp. CF011]MBW9145135.1 NAD(P)/FAD-dependent oxidoreductase [Clostridium sp. CM027]MBW9148375.1 NAD(P)/FAD-dependent oxidoreductase [Clostridium sp. CM028]UVE40271.1 NAD(P)/FAD-dependent oxidoreductase [Clostridium sp. CM027]WAG69215.1 NAD(P)/FAD-dependent oxidoreductase [Clostridium sp. CF011]
MGERYDIAIIGTGPAGLEAAISAKIRNKNIIIFGSKELSPKLVKAAKVNNFLGFYNVSGKDLKNEFAAHVAAMGIGIVNERINNVYAMGDYFALMVNEKIYEAKAIILATGIEYTKALKGEEEFLGKGVGYCATCDAPLYKGKTVVIVGYNKESEEETNYVSELSGKTYYIPMYKGEYDLNSNVEIIKNKPLEIVGEDVVTKVILEKGEITTDGIFMLRDSVSPSQLVPGLEIEEGHIKVDRSMKTNIEGCFAAGDCIGKPYQYIKAAGEGLVAALSAVTYLDKEHKNK